MLNPPAPFAPFTSKFDCVSTDASLRFAAMQNGKIQSVAILGGGPTASTLGTLLARAGVKVGMWCLPRRVPIIVGESLVPAVIPMLRMLGVEDEVRGYSKYKPGATINLTPTMNLAFPFNNIRGPLPPYAYNVPRDKFDDTLLAAARAAGVKVIEAAAGVQRIPGTDRVQLSRETLAAAGTDFPTPPDFIVDATGRVRLLPNLLEIPSRKGPRQDTALFAHVDQAKVDHDGHVHTTRLDHGWSWRIPLPDRMSLGVVIGSEFLPKFGASKEERYDNLLRQDSVLNKVAGDSKRLTPVVEHTNYQLVSERIVGDGWALVGDTGGFIDPVFSSGLQIGMKGAVALAGAIRKNTTAAFQRYQRDVIHHLQCWHQIAESFYDGRLFTSFNVGQMLIKKHWLMRLVYPYISNEFGKIFTGAASDSNYSLGLMRFVVDYGAKQQDPRELMIH